MKKVYFVATKSGSLVSKFLGRCIDYHRKNNNSGDIPSYTHASLAAFPTLKMLSTFSVVLDKQGFRSGFINESIESGANIKWPESDLCVIQIILNDEQEKIYNEIMRFYSENRDNFGYNYLSVFGALFGGIDINLEKKLSCSLFVAKVLSECGVIKFSLPISAISAYDICLQMIKEMDSNSRFRLIYRGPINKYPYKEDNSLNEESDLDHLPKQFPQKQYRLVTHI